MRRAYKCTFSGHGGLSLRLILGCQSSTALPVDKPAKNRIQKVSGSSSGAFLWMP
ncbi:hypothetical protein [Bartonella sp. CL50QHWL]|uniref:hypothetical protein n=1 Tax=Bartonella sp. CL50QHWL TaxID=3243536 RepID=UPI0035D00F88